MVITFNTGEITVNAQPLHQWRAVCALLLATFITTTTATAQLEPLEPTETLEPLTAQPDTPSRLLQSKAKANFVPGTRLYVNATSLALRNAPRVDANLIHYIQKDELITALDDGAEPVALEIGGKKGQWLYVQHGQHKGYVFDAYLKPEPASLSESIDFICIPGQRVGPITAETTLEDLQNELGEVNFSMARIPIGEGEFEEGTAIFPGDKQKQVIVQWAVPNVKPKAVIIAGTQWRTQSGIGIGVPLSTLVQINQAPVSFAGFGWDYAGFVTSWRGGKLESTDTLRTKLLAYLAPTQPYLPTDFEALSGDSEFSSSTPEAQKLNLKVSSMTVMISE